MLAAESFLERDLEVVGQIIAAARAALAAPATAHELAKHLVEDIGKAAGKSEIARSARATLLESGVAEPIVGGAFLIILQDVIRLVDFFKFLLGAFVSRVAIRVMFHRELAIGRLELVGARRSCDTENLVKILLSHGKWRFDKELCYPTSSRRNIRRDDRNRFAPLALRLYAEPRFF